jgi:hypothetical protein
VSFRLHLFVHARNKTPKTTPCTVESPLIDKGFFSRFGYDLRREAFVVVEGSDCAGSNVAQ